MRAREAEHDAGDRDEAEHGEEPDEPPCAGVGHKPLGCRQQSPPDRGALGAAFPVKTGKRLDRSAVVGGRRRPLEQRGLAAALAPNALAHGKGQRAHLPLPEAG